MAQKLVIIGNGMAPGRMLEHLFEADPDHFQVTIFNAEPRVNYDRIMLSPVLSGEKSFDQIVIHAVFRPKFALKFLPLLLRNIQPVENMVPMLRFADLPSFSQQAGITGKDDSLKLAARDPQLLGQLLPWSMIGCTQQHAAHVKYHCFDWHDPPKDSLL